MKNQKTPDSRAMSRRSNSGRRDFLRRSGTVVSAMLAPAAAGIAHAGTGESLNIENRLRQNSGQPALLEDTAEISKLYRDYAAHLATQASHSAPLPQQSGTGIAQLRLMQDPAQQADTITVAPDRRTATAQFHCVAQIAVPLRGHGSLLEMARLQGQHSETWWESGIHELDCVKTSAGWKIRRVVYRKAGQQDGGQDRAAESLARSTALPSPAADPQA
jgi:hypothetical protein